MRELDPRQIRTPALQVQKRALYRLTHFCFVVIICHLQETDFQKSMTTDSGSSGGGGGGSTQTHSQLPQLQQQREQYIARRMPFPQLTRGSSVHTRARTHRVNKSIDTRIQQKQEQHNDYWQQHSSSSSRRAQQQQQQHAAAAAARQRAWPATSERASFRPFVYSVPWQLRVFGVCHVCSVLADCVVSRVLCVVCWLFLATGTIRAQVMMYV